MAQKSHGSSHGTRYKLSSDSDRTLTVNQRMKNFEEGEKVRIKYHPSVQKGRAHHRFHGRTAEVTGERGDALEIKLEDKGKQKTLYLKAVHLEEVGG